MSQQLSLSIKARLFKLAWPLFLESLLVMAVGIVDTMMIARFDNDAAGAIGVGNQIIWLFYWLFMIVSVGTGILTAQYLGAKQHDTVATVAIASLLINLVIGIVGTAFLLIFANDFLKMLQLSGSLLAYGTTYVVIVGSVSVIQSVSFSLSTIIHNHGYTKVGMSVSIIANIVNVVLNYLLIFGVPSLGIPAMGVVGAAIATVVTKVIAFVILFWFLAHRMPEYLSLRWLKPFPKTLLKDLFHIGFPGAGENISYTLGQLFVTGFITTIGVIALNTTTFYGNLAMFIYMFGSSMTSAASILVGNFVGEGRKTDAKSLGIFTFKISLFSTLVMNFFLFLLIRPLIGIYTDNVEIIRLAAVIVLLDIPVEIGRAANIVFGTSLRSSGDVLFPVLFAIVISWTVMIPLVWLFGIKLGYGLPGVFIALAIDELIRGGMLMFRWYSNKWQNKSFVRQKPIIAEAKD